MIAERTHPVVIQGAGQRAAVVWPPAEVEGAVHERVVHRDRPVPVARGSFRKDRGQRCAHADRNILDEVVWQVSRGLQTHIESRVSGEGDEHVTQERLPGRPRGIAAARYELAADRRLSRLTN